MEVRSYAIRACSLTCFELRKRLLKFTGGECLFDLLPWGGMCGLCKASVMHDCFHGVLITFATADLHILLNES